MSERNHSVALLSPFGLLCGILLLWLWSAERRSGTRGCSPVGGPDTGPPDFVAREYYDR
jgi:hypothetical protein